MSNCLNKVDSGIHRYLKINIVKNVTYHTRYTTYGRVDVNQYFECFIASVSSMHMHFIAVSRAQIKESHVLTLKLTLPC